MAISKAYSTGNKPNEFVSILDHGASTAKADNSTEIQAAIDDAISKNAQLKIPYGKFPYATTLKIGSGVQISGENGHLDGNDYSILEYTGTGDGFNSKDNTVRQLHGYIENLCIYCSNTSNTGIGLNLETFGFLRVENVTVKGKAAGGGFATGVKISSASGLLGIDSCTYRNIQVLYCGNGFHVVGVSGSQVADCIFDSCGVNFMQNPDATANSSAIAFHFDQFTDRIPVFGCYYKQDGAFAMNSGFKLSGNYPTLMACGGEVNQSVDEILIDSTCVGWNIFGFNFQDRTRYTNNSANRGYFSSQSQPLEHNLGASDTFDFLKFTKNTANILEVDTNGDQTIGAGSAANPNSYGRIINIRGFAPGVVLSETDSGKNWTIGANGTSLYIYDGTTLRFEIEGANIIMPSLPTSSAGLPSGALWNNSGVVNIV